MASAQRHWLGLALLPQASVALGIAVVAVEHFPAAREWLLPTVVDATAIVELVGPILTRQTLFHTDQISTNSVSTNSIR